jgi:hypothetical protein
LLSLLLRRLFAASLGCSQYVRADSELEMEDGAIPEWRPSVISALIAGACLLLGIIVLIAVSQQEPGASFRKVRRAIRREAKFATKQLRELERYVRSLLPVEPTQEDETTSHAFAKCWSPGGSGPSSSDTPTAARS